MTPQEMIDVITAFRDGKPVETNDGSLDWWPVLSPQFNFHRYTYRVKPPALRPHWPAIIRLPGGQIAVTTRLYTNDDSVSFNLLIGFVRLATEYPPVMLP